MDSKTEIVQTRQYRYVITFVMYFCYFVYAMNLYITGPSLLDLKKIYKTSFSKISNVNTVRSFAYTFGAFSGFVYQYINRQLVFMFFLIVISITMVLTPILPSMDLLFINFAISGFASGGIESGADVWILEMWQQECGPFVQALHFTFGVGSILTPLIVEPFLSEKNNNFDADNDNTTETLIINLLDSNATETRVLYSSQISSNETVFKQEIFKSRIYIPYSCGAIAIAFSAFIMGGLYCYKKYIPPESRVHKPVKQELTIWQRIKISFTTQLMPTKSILVLILLSANLMSIFLGLEWAQFNYFPSFAHFSKLHITERRAAVISTGLAVAFTVGRGISIPISHYLRPKSMIFGSLVLLLIANLIFLFFGNISETYMWFGNIVFGLGLSSIYGAIYAMVEEQTAVNNLMGVLFIFMSGLTSSVYPIIIGYYIESEPMVLIYVNMISTIISFLFMISIHIIIRKYIETSSFQTIL